MKILVYIITATFLVTFGDAAKILAVIFTPSFSHQVVFRPIWRELAKRGHQIVLLTTDPMQEPDLEHLREIDLKESYHVMEEYGASDTLTNAPKGYKEMLDNYTMALSKTADWQLSHPEVQGLIRNQTEHFDLIMIETMFPTHLAFVDRFKAPFIGLCSMDALPRVHKSIGNFMHPIAYPDYIFSFRKNLTFLQRIISTVLGGLLELYGYSIYTSEDKFVKKHFGDGIRPLLEIEKDMSLLFINANPLFHQLRPAGPNTIQIGGGAHLKEPQPLPQDLQIFMDSGTAGVVYFSLGTNVKGSLLSDEFKTAILGAFADLPYKFLWKFEEEDLPGKPDNVKIMKWVPQQDLFRHPNVKLFITQCGLQSIEEALFNQVAMVGIPFFGDQPRNCKIMEDNGLGLVVSKSNLTKEVLQDAITKVVTNPTYRERAQEIADLITDVEMSGLDKAVWWTEYAIRTKGAKHLRNPIIDLPFYKLYMLDVIAFVLLIIISLIYVTVKVLFYLLKLMLPKKDVKKKRE